MLSVESFSKSYSGNKILDISSMKIPKGLHWIKGVNGSGKSTFFRSIAGIIPFEGDILWDGFSVKNHEVEYRMRVNISEAEPLYPDFLSGYEVLRFIAEAKKAYKGQLEGLADVFNVGHYWKNASGTYSSGMLKKISLISAFLGNPELVILDEPLITIDTYTKEQLFRLIKESNISYSVSFLISSHQEAGLDELGIRNVYRVENQTMVQDV